MSLFIADSFERGGAFPIDKDLVMTKAQMRSVNDNVMPNAYFTVCEDDGQLYLYRKTNTVDGETGKYRLQKGGVESVFVSVDTLPDTGEVDKIYLVPNSGSGGNVKDEYVWVEDDTLPAGGFFELIGSTEIDLSIGESFTTNIGVGGIQRGTEINSTDSIASLLKQILTTTYYPTYNAPSASLSYSAPALAKVGADVSALAATVAFNAGAIMLDGAKQADRAGAATSYSLTTNGAATDYSDTNDTGSFNVPALTRATKGNITVSGTVNYAQGPQPKDSNNKDYGTPLEAGSVNTSSKTIEFILPFYHGINASDAISDLTGLTEDLSKKGQKSYSYTADNQYLYLAYDAAYGDLTAIKDANNIENLGAFTKSTITHEGQTYNLYRSKYAITGSPSFIFMF